AAARNKGPKDLGVRGGEGGTALKFTKAQTHVLLFFSARSRGRPGRRRRPGSQTMVRHLKVNRGQSYRPAHPPGAPSAAVRDRPAPCSLSQARPQSAPRSWGPGAV